VKANEAAGVNEMLYWSVQEGGDDVKESLTCPSETEEIRDSSPVFAPNAATRQTSSPKKKEISTAAAS